MLVPYWYWLSVIVSRTVSTLLRFFFQIPKTSLFRHFSVVAHIFSNAVLCYKPGCELRCWTFPPVPVSSLCYHSQPSVSATAPSAGCWPPTPPRPCVSAPPPGSPAFSPAARFQPSAYDPTSASIHTHTTPSFNGPLSRTTRVSRYQKGKTNRDFTEARDSEWQWHQLGHMQVCTSLQTDSHASTPPLSFLQARCLSCLPTNSVKALKAHICCE